MSLWDELRELNPNISRLSEVEIYGSSGSIIGWNSFILDDKNFVVAGGTSTVRQQARRKAFAESIERSLVYEIFNNPKERSRFGLDERISSAGFAVGFEREPTLLRSICEGIEFCIRDNLKSLRFPFVLSQHRELTELAAHLSTNFEKIDYYSLPIERNTSYFDLPKLSFYLTVGRSRHGLVAGYRVSPNESSGWEHCLIEMDRNCKNLSLVLSRQLNILDPTLVADLRIFEELGVNYFTRTTDSDLKLNFIQVLLQEYKKSESYFSWRSIFKLGLFDL